MSSSYGEAGGDSTPDHRTDNEQSGRKLSSQQPLKRTKRRKASRACFHCQKAHLTCDDSRPCQRCIKRGLDESCQDGIRKKAKYLQDVDNARMQALQRQYSEPPESTTSDAWEATTPRMNSVRELKAPAGTVNLASVSKPADGRENSNALFGENLLFDYPPLSSYDFDSKAANLEYSMLSTMLGNVATPGTEHGTSPDHFTFPSPTVNGFHRGMPSRQQTLTPDQRSVHSDSSWNQMPFAGAPVPLSLPLARPASLIAQNSSPAMPNQQPDPTNGGNLLTPQPHTTPISPSMPGQNHVGQAPTSNQAGTPVVSTQGYTDPHGQRPTPVARRPFTPGRTEPSSVYKSITKPFSYTNGYHLLNNYIRSRFQKDDLLRIARAIVGYRPSFIALTKTLREEDLTFMEVCFQRTLLEYEKFVGYSGTPTIIWRRTGQIELVGKEFCLLTQWSREQLLSKQTFIVELMDDSSVVEYFEKFSAHAFGDTSSVQTTCVLMTPNRRAVPCAFCFTIKRDVFDIPMMIVGNFLPVL